MARNQFFQDKAVSLYYQIGTILRRKILQGEYQPGSRIPGEKELEREYGVSRITVRQSLAYLKDEGFIFRKRGKGTYVSLNRKSLEPIKLSGSLEDLLRATDATSAKILSVSSNRVSKKVTDFLKLPEGTEVFRIEKIRLVKRKPVSYVLNYLPPSIGKRIKSRDLPKKSLYRVFEEDLGITIGEATQLIEADVADSYIAALLEVRVGDPLLRIEREVVDANYEPIEYVSVLYRGDRYSYITKLERKNTPKGSQ